MFDAQFHKVDYRDIFRRSLARLLSSRLQESRTSSSLLGPGPAGVHGAGDLTKKIIRFLTKSLPAHEEACETEQEHAEEIWFQADTWMCVSWQKCYQLLTDFAKVTREDEGRRRATAFWDRVCKFSRERAYGLALWKEHFRDRIREVARHFLLPDEQLLLETPGWAETSKLAAIWGADEVEPLERYRQLLQTYASHLCSRAQPPASSPDLPPKEDRLTSALSKMLRDSDLHPTARRQNGPVKTPEFPTFRASLVSSFEMARLATDRPRIQLSVSIPLFTQQVWFDDSRRTLEDTHRVFRSNLPKAQKMIQDFVESDAPGELSLKNGVLRHRWSSMKGDPPQPGARSPEPEELRDGLHEFRFRWVSGGAVFILGIDGEPYVWTVYREKEPQTGLNAAFGTSETRLEQALPDSLIAREALQKFLVVYETDKGDNAVRFRDIRLGLSMATGRVNSFRSRAMSLLYPDRKSHLKEGVVRLRHLGGPASVHVRLQQLGSPDDENDWPEYRTENVFIAMNTEDASIQVFRFFHWRDYPYRTQHALRDGELSSIQGEPLRRRVFLLPLMGLYNIWRQMRRAGKPELPLDLRPWLDWGDILPGAPNDPDTDEDMAWRASHKPVLRPPLKRALEAFFRSSRWVHVLEHRTT